MSSDETNGDNSKHQMDFILKQQAVFSSDMITLKERMVTLQDNIQQQAENIDKLAAVVAQLAETVEINRQETHDAINGLILGNEATRDLANKAAQLAINVSQRLTQHEQKPHE